MTPTPEGKQLAADLANAAHAGFGGSAWFYNPSQMCSQRAGALAEALARLATEHLALKAKHEEALADLREIDRLTRGPIHKASDLDKAHAFAAKYRVETDPLLIEARKLVAARYNPDYAMEAIEATLRGEDDDTDAVQNCLAALKRGYEIGGKS